MRVLDLRGVFCPINWVRVKLTLEEMEVGEVLEVLLDDGASIRNVPRSIVEDGHKIKETLPEGSYYRVIIERG